MGLPRLLPLLLLAGGVAACQRLGAGPAGEGPREVVLGPGGSVHAVNATGPVTIEWVDPIRRRITWRGGPEVVVCLARRTRWHGHFGLLSTSPWPDFSKGPTIVYVENLVNLENEEELGKWLFQSSEVLDWVHTADGLVVGYGISPTGQRVNVSLHRLLLGGERPAGLAGADPDRIRMEGQPPPPPAVGEMPRWSVDEDVVPFRPGADPG